jgi:predicted GNAT family acetyltransferase
MATPAAPDDIAVTHNEAAMRFEALVLGELAVCEYQREGNRMIFTHTYVPTELRGRGVAQKLVRVALEYAQQHGHRIVPACSYVDVFVKRSPEFRALVET